MNAPQFLAGAIQQFDTGIKEKSGESHRLMPGLLLVVDNPPTNPFVDHLPSRDGLQHMGDDGDSVDEEDCGTRTNKNDKKDSTEGTHDA